MSYSDLKQALRKRAVIVHMKPQAVFVHKQTVYLPEEPPLPAPDSRESGPMPTHSGRRRRVADISGTRRRREER